MEIKRVGILTGGGDCPGLNAVIRAVVRKGMDAYGYEVRGVLSGWQGMLECQYEDLDLEKVSGILPKGGTIIGTSRTNPFNIENGAERITENMEKVALDALIAIGGDDTLGVAKELFDRGIRVVGVPKTIDNDISGTDYTFGFDSAINIVMEAIDRIHTTAESHNRVMVVEVMGRHTGWIAIESGIAGGADIILIPEQPFSMDEVVEVIKRRHGRGKDFSIVVVAEGAKIQTEEDKDGSFVLQDARRDEFGHVRLGGIGSVLTQEIERRTGYETRVTVLGHIQRGGTPTAFDRILGTRFGIAAIDLVHQGKFGKMVSLQGNQIVPIDLAEAIAEPKKVDPSWYELAAVFFG